MTDTEIAAMRAELEAAGVEQPVYTFDPIAVVTHPPNPLERSQWPLWWRR